MDSLTKIYKKKENSRIFGPVSLSPKPALGDLFEFVWIFRGEELESGRDLRLLYPKSLLQILHDRFTRVNKKRLLAKVAFESLCDEWEVSAAKYHGIWLDAIEIVSHRSLYYLSFKYLLLYQWHKKRRGFGGDVVKSSLFEQCLIFLTRNRRTSADDEDVGIFVLQFFLQSHYSWLYHTYHWEISTLAKFWQSMGTDGVAGGDEDIGIKVFKKLQSLKGVADDGVFVLGPVGDSGRIAKVDDLVKKVVLQQAFGNSKPTYTTIEKGRSQEPMPLRS